MFIFMKKSFRQYMVTAIISFALMLSGCSAVEQVSQSLDYVNQTTEYIQQVSNMGTELQRLAPEAASSPDALSQMKESLNQIQTKANDFAQLKPPAIGESIHQQLVQYSNQLSDTVVSYKNQIEQYGVTAENWEQTGIPALIANMNKLQEQVNRLGGS